MSSERRAVWVVDDSPFEAKAIHRLLAERFAVEMFADGSTMLERLSGSTPPDVLVLDWVLPGLSGVEVCRFLRTSPRTLELPVLLLTSHQSTQEVVEGLTAGANDYVTKPYVPEELVARVSALVRSKVLREEVAQAEAALVDLLEHHPDPLVTVNRNGTVSFVNAEAVSMLGRERASQLVGRLIAELLPGLALPSPDAIESVTLPDLKLGAAIYEPAARAFPGGKPAWLGISFRDVTAKRRADTRRLDFYSVVAHDLRAPMQAMQLRLGLIEQRHVPALPALAPDVRKLEKQVRDLSALIDDFLDVARMEGVGLKLERERVDLLALAREAIDVLQPLADDRGLEVLVEPTAQAAFVEGDAQRLRQVLSNLISNAIKFTASGGRVTVSVAREAPAGRLRCTIADTGQGISEIALPHVFDRFARADERVAGTGLGLMIVRDVVEAHGGSVGVASELGKGSAFWIELDAA